MNLTDVLTGDCVVVPMKATDKDSAIRELVDRLAEHKRVDDGESVLKAVLEREATRSTGIGHGLAVPHGKSRGCPKLAMAIGKPAEPIDFESADGKPVELIVLLASPLDQTGPHIQALAQISRLMLIDSARRQMSQAQTPEALYDVIKASMSV